MPIVPNYSPKKHSRDSFLFLFMPTSCHRGVLANEVYPPLPHGPISLISSISPLFFLILHQFPEKSMFYVKPEAAALRRYQLQRWLQKIGANALLVKGEHFQNFLLNAQKEVQKGESIVSTASSLPPRRRLSLDNAVC